MTRSYAIWHRHTDWGAREMKKRRAPRPRPRTTQPNQTLYAEMTFSGAAELREKRARARAMMIATASQPARWSHPVRSEHMVVSFMYACELVCVCICVLVFNKIISIMLCLSVAIPGHIRSMLVLFSVCVCVCVYLEDHQNKRPNVDDLNLSKNLSDLSIKTVFRVAGPFEW